MEDIHYWEVSSWKNFVQNTLVPLRDLAKFLAETENLASDPLRGEAKKIEDLAGKAIEIAEEVFGEPMSEIKILPEEDLLEIVRKFLEIGINTTAGHSKHTFFVWSTRKITKSYLEEHYPELKDPEKFNKITKILGWSTYWEPPPIKSKIAEDYRVYAYLDYLSLLKIHYELPDKFRFQILSLQDKPTLGGLICKLNDALWKLIMERPGIATAYEIPDAFRNYFIMVDEMLKEVGWENKHYYISAAESSEYNYLYEFEGCAVTMLRRRYSEYELYSKFSVFELWDILMPPMFLGKYELILTADKRRGVIIRRWW